VRCPSSRPVMFGFLGIGRSQQDDQQASNNEGANHNKDNNPPSEVANVEAQQVEGAVPRDSVPEAAAEHAVETGAASAPTPSEVARELPAGAPAQAPEPAAPAAADEPVPSGEAAQAADTAPPAEASAGNAGADAHEPAAPNGNGDLSHGEADGPGTVAEQMKEQVAAAAGNVKEQLESQRKVGRVKTYNAQKRFGFIVADGVSRDIFVHQSHLVGRTGLTIGEVVTFDMTYDGENPQARMVKGAKTSTKPDPVWDDPNAQLTQKLQRLAQLHASEQAVDEEPVPEGGLAVGTQVKIVGHPSDKFDGEAGHVSAYSGRQRGYAVVLDSNGLTVTISEEFLQPTDEDPKPALPPPASIEELAARNLRAAQERQARNTSRQMARASAPPTEPDAALGYAISEAQGKARGKVRDTPLNATAPEFKPSNSGSMGMGAMGGGMGGMGMPYGARPDPMGKGKGKSMEDMSRHKGYGKGDYSPQEEMMTFGRGMPFPMPGRPEYEMMMKGKGKGDPFMQGGGPPPASKGPGKGDIQMASRPPMPEGKGSSPGPPLTGQPQQKGPPPPAAPEVFQGFIQSYDGQQDTGTIVVPGDSPLRGEVLVSGLMKHGTSNLIGAMVRFSLAPGNGPPIATNVQITSQGNRAPGPAPPANPDPQESTKDVVQLLQMQQQRHMQQAGSGQQQPPPAQLSGYARPPDYGRGPPPPQQAGPPMGPGSYGPGGPRPGGPPGPPGGGPFGGVPGGLMMGKGMGPEAGMLSSQGPPRPPGGGPPTGTPPAPPAGPASGGPPPSQPGQMQQMRGPPPGASAHGYGPGPMPSGQPGSQGYGAPGGKGEARAPPPAQPQAVNPAPQAALVALVEEMQHFVKKHPPSDQGTLDEMRQLFSEGSQALKAAHKGADTNAVIQDLTRRLTEFAKARGLHADAVKAQQQLPPRQTQPPPARSTQPPPRQGQPAASNQPRRPGPQPSSLVDPSAIALLSSDVVGVAIKSAAANAPGHLELTKNQPLRATHRAVDWLYGEAVNTGEFGWFPFGVFKVTGAKRSNERSSASSSAPSRIPVHVLRGGVDERERLYSAKFMLHLRHQPTAKPELRGLRMAPAEPPRDKERRRDGRRRDEPRDFYGH